MLARALLALSLSTLLPSDASAQTELAGLQPADSAPSHFGWSVAVDGPRAVIGAPGDAAALDEAGAAYVFELGPGGWTEVAKLEPGDPSTGNLFGYAVAVDGDRIVVGAPRRGTFFLPEIGGAYVFERQGASWVETAILTGSDDLGTGFGCAVAVDGVHAAVGAPEEDGVGTVRVYGYFAPWGTWIIEATLPGLFTGDERGAAVALEDDLLVVGDPGSDFAFLSPDNAGRVVFFRDGGGGWNPDGQVAASSDPIGRFGSSVAVRAGRVLAGAPGVSLGRGAAYVLEEEGAVWVVDEELEAHDGSLGDGFGTSVALSDDGALVGAPGADAALAGTGAGYHYLKVSSSWYERCKLSPADAATGDGFGRGVALLDEEALIGASGDDSGCPFVFPACDRGELYVFDVDPLVPYGCGVNPAGTIWQFDGQPAINEFLQIAVFNNQGTQGGGAAWLALGATPPPNYPCGTLVAGWGMAGGGAPGELLVPQQDAVLGPIDWDGVLPVVFQIFLPDEPGLVGTRLYFQGLLRDPDPAAVVPLALTEALDVCVGVRQ
ncbi:MAG: hypothetical protein AAF682_11385 [Planctomycetota bacterium]